MPSGSISSSSASTAQRRRSSSGRRRRRSALPGARSATEPEDEAGEPVPEADAAADEQVVEQESGVEEEDEVEARSPPRSRPAAEAPTEFIDHAATLDAEPAPEAPAVVEPPRPGRARTSRGRAPAPAPSSRDDEVESWLEEEEPPAEASEAEEAEEAEGEERRCARGHARLPPGDAGARPPLVRAEAAARLRLRLARRAVVSSHLPSVWPLGKLKPNSDSDTSPGRNSEM